MSTKAHTVQVRELSVSNDKPFTLLAGPCQMESRAHALETAQSLKEMTDRLGIGLVYKSSFDKANRTSVDGVRGLGMAESLDVFAEVR
ncbi:MAG: 3-deoxy-8-phosphooctulonate synthase, partial [Rhodospirillales bacterium]|nr:3-deoxy-8-phosphooctulonate synthase [Rhodospirillales bacterium]